MKCICIDVYVYALRTLCILLEPCNVELWASFFLRWGFEPSPPLWSPCYERFGPPGFGWWRCCWGSLEWAIGISEHIGPMTGSTTCLKHFFWIWSCSRVIELNVGSVLKMAFHILFACKFCQRRAVQIEDRAVQAHEKTPGRVKLFRLVICTSRLSWHQVLAALGSCAPMLRSMCFVAGATGCWESAQDMSFCHRANPIKRIVVFAVRIINLFVCLCDKYIHYELFVTEVRMVPFLLFRRHQRWWANSELGLAQFPCFGCALVQAGRLGFLGFLGFFMSWRCRRLVLYEQLAPSTWLAGAKLPELTLLTTLSLEAWPIS